MAEIGTVKLPVYVRIGRNTQEHEIGIVTFQLETKVAADGEHLQLTGPTVSEIRAALIKALVRTTDTLAPANPEPVAVVGSIYSGRSDVVRLIGGGSTSCPVPGCGCTG